jgi:hypothetical protein
MIQNQEQKIAIGQAMKKSTAIHKMEKMIFFDMFDWLLNTKVGGRRIYVL